MPDSFGRSRTDDQTRRCQGAVGTSLRVFRARYRTPLGHTRSKTFRRKVELRHSATKSKRRRPVASSATPKLGRMTFADYTSDWLGTKVDLRART